MNKLNWLITVLAGAASLANAQEVDDSAWSELTDEPSRRDLFVQKIHPLDHEKPSTVVSFVLPGKFSFPKDARYDVELDKPRKDVLFGIDVSHYDAADQMGFDRLVDDEINYVYVKATQGLSFKDSKFKTFWSKLAGVPANKRPLKGAYHFLSAAGDAEVQAQKFVDFVRLHTGPNATGAQAFPMSDLPPCIDLEWDIKKKDGPDQWAGQKGPEIVAKVKKCLEKIKELTGRSAMVYTARQWWIDRGIDLKMIEELKDYPVWIADYARKSQELEKPRVFEKRKADIWQFTETAVAPNCYKSKMELDANIFYGTKADFCMMLGVTP
jgi:lysozyme